MQYERVGNSSHIRFRCPVNKSHGTAFSLNHLIGNEFSDDTNAASMQCHR